MAQERKLESPVTLFAAIEQQHHERLRTLAFEEHRSLADLVREAIDEYLVVRSRRTSAKKQK